MGEKMFLRRTQKVKEFRFWFFNIVAHRYSPRSDDRRQLSPNQVVVKGEKKIIKWVHFE